MKKINLNIIINAPIEKVWNKTIELESYKEWAGEFGGGSTYEGSWDRGSKILFIGETRDGMVSEIKENIPYAYISIQHNGYITNGIEDTTSERIKEWAPSFENYTFNDISDADGAKTEFVLEMDATDEFYDMFMDMWPKALLKLKEISEK
jgi:uncharacterized protein YndB with AHSA1/START domain